MKRLIYSRTLSLILVSLLTLEARSESLFLRLPETKASLVADEISSHFKASVLLKGELNNKVLTATFTASTLEEALDAISFLLGVTWRKDGQFYFVGSEDKSKQTKVFDRGVVDDLGGAFDNNARVVGNKILVSGTPEDVEQVSAVIGEFTEFESLTLRVVVCDVSRTVFDDVNEWLRVVEFGSTLNLPDFDFDASAGVEAFSTFIADRNDSEVFADTIVTLGGVQPTTVSVGEILEREVSRTVAVEGGQSEFITSFDRLPIGFSLSLSGRPSNGVWVVDIESTDSSRPDGQRERQVEYKSRFPISPDAGVTRLLALRRASSESSSDKFSLWPKLKRSSSSDSERYFIVLAEPYSGLAPELSDHRSGMLPSLSSIDPPTRPERAQKLVKKYAKRLKTRKKSKDSAKSADRGLETVVLSPSERKNYFNRRKR